MFGAENLRFQFFWNIRGRSGLRFSWWISRFFDTVPSARLGSAMNFFWMMFSRRFVCASCCFCRCRSRDFRWLAVGPSRGTAGLRLGLGPFSFPPPPGGDSTRGTFIHVPARGVQCTPFSPTASSPAAPPSTGPGLPAAPRARRCCRASSSSTLLFRSRSLERMSAGRPAAAPGESGDAGPGLARP